MFAIEQRFKEDGSQQGRLLPLVGQLMRVMGDFKSRRSPIAVQPSRDYLTVGTYDFSEDGGQVLSDYIKNLEDHMKLGGVPLNEAIFLRPALRFTNNEGYISLDLVPNNPDNFTISAMSIAVSLTGGRPRVGYHISSYEVEAFTQDDLGAYQNCIDERIQAIGIPEVRIEPEITRPVSIR